MSRGAVAVTCAALALSAGCTVVFPVVGAVRGASGRDLADRCADSPKSTCPPANPPPVDYRATILENALVGVLFDLAGLAVISAMAPRVGLDPNF